MQYKEERKHLLLFFFTRLPFFTLWAKRCVCLFHDFLESLLLSIVVWLRTSSSGPPVKCCACAVLHLVYGMFDLAHCVTRSMVQDPPRSSIQSHLPASRWATQCVLAIVNEKRKTKQVCLKAKRKSNKRPPKWTHKQRRLFALYPSVVIDYQYCVVFFGLWSYITEIVWF